MKKVLITGANGLIARKISEYISDYPSQVVLTSRSESIPGCSHDYFSADLSDIHAFEALLDKLGPDMIIHTAAVASVDYAATHPEETRLINERAVESIARWCGKNKCRLIHFSSDFVFDGQKSVYNENDKPRPLSLYGTTKWMGEKLVSRYAPDHVIIRTILVYGLVPHSARMNFPLWVITRLNDGVKTYITGDQFRSPTYVNDLARATLEMAFSDFRGLLHISGDEHVSIIEFARKVANVFQLDASLLVDAKTSDLHQAGARPMKTAFTNRRLKALINYRPTGIEEALEEMRQSGLQD